MRLVAILARSHKSGAKWNDVKIFPMTATLDEVWSWAYCRVEPLAYDIPEIKKCSIQENLTIQYLEEENETS